MAVDFGTDYSTFPTLDLTFTPITGAQAVAQCVARRLMTPRGALAWDPAFGLDLRGMLSARMTATMLHRWRSQIVAECEKDERVFSAAVAITPSLDNLAATIDIDLTTANGPFKMTLSVSQLTVQLLKVGA